MSIKKGMAKRFFATAAAGAVAMIGLAGIASAAPVDGGAPWDAANADRDGKVTVHKFVGNGTGQTNDGSEVGTVDRVAVEGIKFTFQKVTKVDGVTLDLTKEAGWSKVDDNGPIGEPTLGGSYECTTDALGTCFKDLPVGLYEVTETFGAGFDAAKFPNMTLMAPFYITVPHPTLQGSDVAWNWDLHIYPKNTMESSPEKEVGAPINGVVGGELPWTIKGSLFGALLSSLGVDEEGNPKQLQNYQITDQIIEELSYVEGSVQVSTENGSITFTEADYTVTHVDGKLTVKFTEAGVAKIAKNTDAADRVVVTFKTTVEKLPENGSGALDNEAIEWPNDPDETGEGNSTNKPGPEIPCEPGEEGCTNPGGEECEEGDEECTKPGGEKPTSYWGDMTLTKVNGDKETLEGAQFEVYEGACVSGNNVPADKWIMNGESHKVFASNDQGVVDIKGLWVVNVPAGEALAADASQDYCLVEIVAPQGGYVLPSDGKTITVYPGKNTANTIDIVNTKITGPTLPLTGAAGTALLIVGGLALVGLAGSIVVTSRRRSAENA